MIVMFLFYSDEQALRALPPEGRNGLVERHIAYNQYLDEHAAVLATRGLEPTTAALTVRPSGEGPVVSRGPFAATEEALAGFYLIEVADLDEAVELAKDYPMPDGLGCIELRPVMSSWEYAPSLESPAPAHAIWSLYLDTDSWHEWKVGVQTVRLDGPFRAGTVGHLTTQGRDPMPFTITDVAPDESYSSTTEVAPGAVIRLEHTLTALRGGGTRITHRATVPREALDALGMDFSPKFNAGIHQTLRQLSDAAQRRATSPSG